MWFVLKNVSLFAYKSLLYYCDDQAMKNENYVCLKQMMVSVN